MTDFSQPGDNTPQRAAVSGFCAEPLAETIAARCLSTELICIARWPADPDDPQTSEPHIPITVWEKRARTWAGMTRGLEGWEEWCGPLGLAALAAAWQVTVIDPLWQRNDRLWPVVRDAVHGEPRSGALPTGDFLEYL